MGIKGKYAKYSDESLELAKKNNLHPAFFQAGEDQREAENKKLKYIPKKIWSWVSKEANIKFLIKITLAMIGLFVTIIINWSRIKEFLNCH